MQIKVAKPSDRNDYYVTGIEYVAENKETKTSEHIKLTLDCENFMAGGAEITLFKTGSTATFFTYYFNGLMKANQDSKAEKGESHVPFTKLNDESIIQKYCPRGCKLLNGAKVKVDLDKPMYQVWRSNMPHVTVGYKNGNLMDPIVKDVKAGDYIVDPGTGMKKIHYFVELFIMYTSKDGDAESPLTKYADVWNFATRTLRPIPEQVSAPIAEEQPMEQHAEQAVEVDPFA